MWNLSKVFTVVGGCMRVVIWSLVCIFNIGVGCAKSKSKGTTPINVPPDTPPPVLTTQDSNPVPTPTPITEEPTPTPTPSSEVPMRNGAPVRPTNPIVEEPHVINATGGVQIMSGATLTANICQDRTIKYYYVPCTSTPSICSFFLPKACGYSTCFFN